jgi:dipeptidyl aminopeptidase/acylaminoacyl peptidase
LLVTAGRRLGPYEIVAPLGAGGMGEVWRARDARLDREVAIKVLPAELAGDPDRLARFEREAKLLASLNHPNIAHVYGFESATLTDGSTAHFLAMELVEGEELAERLKRGPIPLDEALPIAKQIAEALEEAHEHGIVHRDLKPGKTVACTTCPQADPFARGCRGKLRLVDVGTGQTREIDTYDAAAPAWSPDGRRIAYWGLDASESGWRDLYLVDTARGEPILLTHDAAVDWNPIWSEDGTGLDLLSDRGGSPNLWRLPIDVRTGRPSGPPRSMLLPTELASRICRSGDRWAYVSLALRASIGSWTFDPDRLVARGPANAVLATVGRIFTQSLSPDARSVAYTTVFPRQDLFIVPIEGGPPTQLTDDVAVDRYPSWDPNGRRILFMSNRGGRYEFWAIDADGGGLEPLTRTTGESHWRGNLSPDRRRLSGVSPLGTDIFDASGPPPWEHYEHLVDPANRASSRFRGYVWSRDAQRLAGSVGIGPDTPRVAVWSFRDRKLRVLDLRGSPIAWLPDDRRLLVELTPRDSVTSLVTVDPETAKTEAVDAPGVNGWEELTIDRSLHTLLGFRNDTEADIWLAEGLE